jgi:hypothetical protein
MTAGESGEGVLQLGAGRVERTDRVGRPYLVIWPLAESQDHQVVGFEDPGDCPSRQLRRQRAGREPTEKITQRCSQLSRLPRPDPVTKHSEARSSNRAHKIYRIGAGSWAGNVNF